MTHKYINITVSIIALSLILLVTFKYCGKKTYTQAEVEAINLSDSLKKQDYIDSLDFTRGQLALQQERANTQQEMVTDLQKQMDSLTTKHEVTKANIKWVPDNKDTGFVLAPNEYINECEGCFTLLGKYKKESGQLKFERDSYDSLMRQQADIQENRIKELDAERLRFNKLLNDCRLARAYVPACEPTRKLKYSIMGMFGNPFLPKGAGVGFIYEDKKFNEFGGHFLLTDDGPVYLLHIAKTISLRRKK